MDENPEYRPGFVVHESGAVPDRPAALDGWAQKDLGGWSLLHHPDTRVQIETVGPDLEAVVLGDLFVAHGDLPLAQHLREIALGGRANLDELSGRFALMIRDHGRMTLLHDPLASQSVFYSGDGRAAGSHAALLGELLGITTSRRRTEYMRSEEYRSRATRFLPGDLTLFEGIHLLVPNNELELPTARTRRYWPHAPLTETSAADAARVWDEYFTRYARFLAGRGRPALGLTGGFDSRAIIASLRAKGLDMRCETWDSMGEAESARIPAMVRHLEVEHRWIDTRRRSEDDTFLRIRAAARSAAGFTRGTPALPSQVADGAGPTDLLVTGHGGGVLAGGFSRAAKPWLPDDPLKRAYGLYAGTTKLTASKEYRDFTLRAFRGYFDRGNVLGGDSLGHDLGDLLYWEHRMANWAAVQIATFAVAIDVHAGLNSRRLFEAFWGLPPELRRGKTAQREIMASYDPVLAAL